MKIIRIFKNDNSLIEEIAKLYCEVWKQAPWNEDFWTLKKVIEGLDELYSSLNEVVLAAVVDEKVVGFSWGQKVRKNTMEDVLGGNQFISLFLNNISLFYIDELAVDLNFRGERIGQKLLKRLLHISDEEDNFGWCLRTHNKAKEAKRIYNKFGFKDSNIEDIYFEESIFWVKYKK